MKSYSINLSLFFVSFFFAWSLVTNAQDITVETINYCSPDNKGSIELSVVTGAYSPPFQFIWSDAFGNILFEEETSGVSSITGLSPGAYCVNIESSDGCSAESCELVVEAELTIESLTRICICPNG